VDKGKTAENKAYLYAKRCADKKNHKVGVYVKLQAQSWIDIYNGKNKEARYDEKAYDRICKILKLMVHPDLKGSMYDGLEDYAWFFIVAVLCTKLRNSRRSTQRLFLYCSC